MTFTRFTLLCGLALAALSPVTAQAQSSDQCYETAANICGSLSLGDCFVNQGNWEVLPEACHGDIQTQIEMDREFYEQQAADAEGMSSDQCYQEAASICGALSLGDCFVNQGNWEVLPALCHGDIQRQIEMDREFEEQAVIGAPDGGGAQTGGYVGGMAWGGKMRDGPGIRFAQVGSMTEGERIEIVGDTGEWYNDFQWYEVIAHSTQAFVWGGNFCHDGGRHMEGSGGPCN